MFDRKPYGGWTLEDVGKHWDETEDYDALNKETYSHFMRFVDGYRLSDFDKVKPRSRILDICSRTGGGSLYFSEHCEDCTFVCFDVTKRMMDICDKRLTEAEVKHKMTWFTSHHLPTTDNEFDYVLCFETIEHIPKPDVFLKELHRVLKPGCEMILTCPNILWEFAHWVADKTGIHHGEGPHRFMSRRELYKDIKAAGFAIEREETNIIVPYGPRWLTSAGRYAERIIGQPVVHLLGLRRIFICRKPE